VAGSGWKWLEVAGSGWKWLEVAGSGWKWLEVAWLAFANALGFNTLIYKTVKYFKVKS
jgi:hypothetical protein